MDSISGSSGNDTLAGTSAAESIFSGDGDDTITGGAGNDSIYGGKDTDTAKYSGASSGYTITPLYEGKNGAFSGYSVVDLVGTDGTDTLFSDVEYLSFSAGTYQLSNGAVILPAGTASADQILGSASADSMYGNAGDDSLYGNAGHDSLTGGAGNDVMDGGTGTDTSVYTQAASKFTLSLSSTGARLTDSTALEGSDQLSNIEKLQFSDKTVYIESQTHASYAALPESLWHFFIVAFNAAPGVTYMNQLSEAYNYGMSVEEIVNVFTSKSQFTDIYPASLSRASMATNLVANIVKSSATSDTKVSAANDIVGALDYGWGIGKVIYTVFGNLANKSLSDATWGNTAKLFANEIAIAKHYTSSLNQSTTDLTTLSHVIASVSETTDVSSDAAMAQLIGVALLSN